MNSNKLGEEEIENTKKQIEEHKNETIELNKQAEAKSTSINQRKQQGLELSTKLAQDIEKSRVQTLK